MKLWMLPRYARAGASSRVRMFQYLPALEAAGFEITVAPFFEDSYLQRLYAGESVGRQVLAALARRIRDLHRSRAADVVWLEKEALPWLPWFMERSLMPPSVPVVTDYDDAVFHRYDLHPRGFVRNLLGSKISSVMAASEIVLAGNVYLARYAEAAGAGRVEIVPTVVDTGSYRPAMHAGRQRPVIGWIGMPATWREYIEPRAELFEAIGRQLACDLVAIGAGELRCSDAGFTHLEWSEASEVSAIQGIDIGIMPLDDSPWARGKCGYKLIQYMACGLPVVASPVGVNTEIVEHGVNGFLAETDQQWREALSLLAGDPELRRRMGDAGRKRVIERYSLQAWAPRVVEMMRSIAEGAGT